jgi:hypothetical protein
MVGQWLHSLCLPSLGSALHPSSLAGSIMVQSGDTVLAHYSMVTKLLVGGGWLPSLWLPARGRVGSAPLITGWFNTIKVQSGDTVLAHESIYNSCAAKAFYSCPAIISRRPRSQNTSEEPQLNSEKDSRRKQARSHVTLEKSS